MSLNIADMVSKSVSVVQTSYDTMMEAAPMAGPKPGHGTPSPKPGATPRPTTPPANPSPPQPVLQGPAQDPNATLKVDKNETVTPKDSTLQSIDRFFGDYVPFVHLPPSHSEFHATVTNSANALTGTIAVNGKDGTMDFTAGNNSLHVKPDGTATITSHADGKLAQNQVGSGVFTSSTKIHEGEVIQIGDAKVKFNFASPDDSKTLGAAYNPERNKLDSIEVVAGNSSPVKIQAERFNAFRGVFDASPEAYVLNGGDEPRGNDVMTSPPSVFKIDDKNWAIADPAVRLGFNGLYSLGGPGPAAGQPAIPAGRLEPDAFTMNPNINQPYDAFTSLLDPTKVQTDHPLPIQG